MTTDPELFKLREAYRAAPEAEKQAALHRYLDSLMASNGYSRSERRQMFAALKAAHHDERQQTDYAIASLKEALK